MESKVARINTLVGLLLIGLVLGTSLSSFSAPSGGNTLRVCDSADDAGLRMDPHFEFEDRNDNILIQIFDLLLKMDIDGNPVPNLAERWNRLNPHTVQFKLRQGILFHNGEPCDANAVKYSIERNIDRKMHSPSYHVLKSIERVDVVDNLTVNIVTKHPDGILLNRLCVAGYIVPPNYIRKVGDGGFERHPVGTGPFKFVKWLKGKELTLERNNRYWGHKLPDMEKIVFKFADAGKRVELLLNGGVDMITDFDPRQVSRIERSGFKVIKEPSFTAVTVLFNMRTKGSPFRNKLVRKAFNHALNVDELIEKVRMGYGIRRATLGVPGEFGYNPYIKPYNYDPERAKDLLRRAGYAKGLTVSMLVDDAFGGTDSALAMAIKDQLAKVGVTLEVRGGNAAGLVAEPRRNPSRPPFQMDMYVKTAPDAMAHVIFREGIVAFESSSPWSLVEMRQLDRLFSKIVQTLDPKEQQRLCHELEQMVYDECLALFTYQEIKLYAMRTAMRYEPFVTGMVNWSQVGFTGG